MVPKIAVHKSVMSQFGVYIEDCKEDIRSHIREVHNSVKCLLDEVVFQGIHKSVKS